MRNWQIVPVLLGLALAGCRHDPEIAYLQRDNRKKESEIFRLRSRVEELEDALNSTPPAQSAGTRVAPVLQIPNPGRTIDGGQSGSASSETAPRFTPPDSNNSPSRTSEPGLPPLNIQHGDEIKPGNPTSGKSSQWIPSGTQPAGSPGAMTDNSAVAQITLHPALTGGVGMGDRAGDEGLLVVVEPRDFSGKIITAPGNVSVALLDPALSGEAARLARWDFAVAETEGMIRTGSQPGIHLRLPWAAPPAHDRLKVFVRYTTHDGRKLQAERLIGVALDASPPARGENLPEAQSTQTAVRPQRPQWSPMR